MRVLLVGLLFTAACYSWRTDTTQHPRVEGSTCYGTDMVVPSSSQCMQDDAVCYQLADGSWCTGSLSLGS